MCSVRHVYPHAKEAIALVNNTRYGVAFDSDCDCDCDYVSCAPCSKVANSILAKDVCSARFLVGVVFFFFSYFSSVFLSFFLFFFFFFILVFQNLFFTFSFLYSPTHSPSQGSSVWTENISLAMEVALSIKAGTVWINGHNMFDAAAGFGECVCVCERERESVCVCVCVCVCE